ncbi:probable calcium-binding protein CML36 [Phragmites australis]|uniref:probable calcium-binding protein CML36 n=1 Tax=Phragmites australis TaxID=29695 RepID=UPI002D77EB65|nr:probable calcium-binding protein CML36 [Phragmites australis]
MMAAEVGPVHVNRPFFSRARREASWKITRSTAFVPSSYKSSSSPTSPSYFFHASSPPPRQFDRSIPRLQANVAMKLSMPFFGSSSAKKQESKGKRSNNGKSSSFASTTSSSSDESVYVTTPRTVLPSASASGAKKPAAVTREELEVALRRVVSSEEELAEMLGEAGVVLEEMAAAEPADEGELKETFAVFDADGDGRISAEELRAVLASLGDERCSVEDCRRMIGGVDTDGDGFVCFDEFTRMMMHGL